MGEKRIDKYLFNINHKIGEASYATVVKGINAKNWRESSNKNAKQICHQCIQKQSYIYIRDDYLRDGLIQEMKIMERLKSPNIVQLLYVIETSDNYYIVQKFCEGGDFDEYLKKKKNLSENDDIKFLVDVLTGFIQLIKNGIIHRDLNTCKHFTRQNDLQISRFWFCKICRQYFCQKKLFHLSNTVILC